MMTFIIPVRHPANSSNWGRLKRNLTETVRSIAAQTHSDWRAIIVANEGSDLPPLPSRFDIEWVTFAPNDRHAISSGTREEVLDAFRFDKGRRVLRGMLRARNSRFFMIVDDDDLVSRHIVAHAAEHPDANGWTVDSGYVWNDGGILLYRHSQLHHICGTSLIIRATLYKLPKTFAEATPEYVKTMLGGHRCIAALFVEKGTPLSPLPFIGAIYRVGHTGSHSQSRGVLFQFVFTLATLLRPHDLMRNLTRLRLVDRSVRGEFFGVAENVR